MKESTVENVMVAFVTQIDLCLKQRRHGPAIHTSFVCLF